jgi:hypothetical protein
VARPGEAPKLHLFGQLKRIVKEWLDAVDDEATQNTWSAKATPTPRC